jgi:hypothetical protein
MSGYSFRPYVTAVLWAKVAKQIGRPFRLRRPEALPETYPGSRYCPHEHSELIGSAVESASIAPASAAPQMQLAGGG